MKPERTPLEHLARGLEEFLRAGADALEVWRQGAGAGRGGEAAMLEQLANEWARFLERGDGPLLGALRQALRLEVSRWEERCADDPAARRVRDLFAALLEVIGGEPTADATRPPRRAPRRKAAR